MTNKFPVLVINLDRSKGRLAHVNKKFPKEELIRIPGIDGRSWESGETTPLGRPKFRADAVSQLVKDKTLAEGALETFPLMPCEVGCALGHKAAWEYVVENELEFAIVLEDDVYPGNGYTGDFQSSIERQGGVPDDADVMFLMRRTGPHSELLSDKRGRLKVGSCNYGYVITRAGAEKAIRAQFPMQFPCDLQWWTSAFKDLQMTSIAEGLCDKGYAYVVKNAIIEPGVLGVHTTMTTSGEKSWSNFHK